MTPLQALRIIEREIEASDIRLSEGSELAEALNTLWNFVLTGEKEKPVQQVTDYDAGFGGQDITYEREPCPLSSQFAHHLPGLLTGCTCEAPDA